MTNPMPSIRRNRSAVERRLITTLVLVGVASAVALAFLLTRLPIEEPALPAAADLPAEFSTLPAFHLIDAQGRPFSRSDLLGKQWVVGFLFTRCHETCPMVAGVMARLQSELPKDVGLLTITVDPRYDVPAVLAQYARSLKADPDRWRFLTGPPDEVYDLLEHGFKVPAKENLDAKHGQEQVSHTTRLAVLDAKARVRGFFDTTDPASLSLLGRRLRMLTKEPL